MPMSTLVARAMPRPVATRGELLAAVYILGCVNGLGAKVITSVQRLGWVHAAAATFDLSAVVIIACGVGVALVLHEKTHPTAADYRLAAVLALLIALPIGALSWIAITLLSLSVLLSRRSSDSEMTFRGALILLAVTVPMLWSRLLFDLFANFILSLDAAVVSWVLGTNRSGNMVQFADNSGTLAIFASCSSLANVSLALLCWVTVSQAVRHRRRALDIAWCLLACASVVAVNVLRISLMGLSSAHYELLHSAPVEIVLNIGILVLIVSICILGTRRDVLASI